MFSVLTAVAKCEPREIGPPTIWVRGDPGPPTPVDLNEGITNEEAASLVGTPVVYYDGDDRRDFSVDQVKIDGDNITFVRRLAGRDGVVTRFGEVTTSLKLLGFCHLRVEQQRAKGAVA